MHVCYYHKSDSVDGGRISARLDLDDTTSFGPETVTMTVDVASLGENELIGYFVHDYSNRSRPDSRELSLSGAFVRVYSGNGPWQRITFPGTRVRGPCGMCSTSAEMGSFPQAS